MGGAQPMGSKDLNLPLQIASTLQIYENINHEDAKTNVENIAKIIKQSLGVFKTLIEVIL